MHALFDPSRSSDVAATLLEALNDGRSHQAALLTGVPERVSAATSAWVWFVALAGADIPAEWRGQQVLRIHDRGESELLARQVRLSEQLIGDAFPIAPTSWYGELGGHPAHLQQRLPGRPAAELLGSTKLKQTVQSLARLQAQLHAINPEHYEVPRVDASAYLKGDLGRRRSSITAEDSTGTWKWLHESLKNAAQPSNEKSVLCHGDFHPLNALVDDFGRISVVDWTDACIGDRHHDVARTIAIYWLASLIADTRVERAGLRLVRNWLGSAHRSAYESASGVRLDDRRLAWWQIVHLYRGWLQLCELAEGSVPDRQSSTTSSFPRDLNDHLLRRCVALRSRV